MLGQHATNRHEVLRLIANATKSLEITNNADAVYQSFLEREEMGATGMTHARKEPTSIESPLRDLDGSNMRKHLARQKTERQQYQARYIADTVLYPFLVLAGMTPSTTRRADRS